MRFGALLGIARCKVQAQAVKVDPDIRDDDGFVARKHRRSGAPRQKRRVMLDRLDQVEHAFGGVRDQRRFVDFHRHSFYASR